MTLDWSDDAIFTKEHADYVEERGCYYCYDFIGKTVAEFAWSKTCEAFEILPYDLSDELFDELARAKPKYALRLAPKHLEKLGIYEEIKELAK